MPQFDGNVTDDAIAYFSNFGPVVKIAAPGVNVLSTYNGAGYA
jgi:subtilisin family serine protease